MAKRPKSPVSKKISKLVREGVPHRQAVAMALSMKNSGRLGPRGGYRRSRPRKSRSKRRNYKFRSSSGSDGSDVPPPVPHPHVRVHRDGD